MSDIFMNGLIKGLHNLATAVWIGAMISLGMIAAPSVKGKHRDGPFCHDCPGPAYKPVQCSG